MNDGAGVSSAIGQIDQLAQAGQHGEAESSCREALFRFAWSADLRVRLAMLLVLRNETTEAESQLRLGLLQDPDSGSRSRQFGLVLSKQRPSAKGEHTAIDQSEFDTGLGAVWARVGNAAYRQQAWPLAVAAYQEALAASPSDAATWNNLASAELKRGRLEESQAAVERALVLAPGHEGAAANYAYILCYGGHREQAFQWLQPRMVTDPLSVELWVRFGATWESMSEWALAAVACRRAHELAPQHEGARELLARILRSQPTVSAATDLLRETVTNQPLPATTWGLYAALFGGLLSMQGRSAEGVQYLKRSVELAPNPARHSGYLLALHYVDSSSPQELLAAHREWNAAYARSLTPVGPSRRERRGGPLRLGFVSGDPGRGPVRYLGVPGIAGLDRARVTVAWYSDRAEDDEYTHCFRAVSDAWRNVCGFADEQLATQIRDDEIDILIDLMGHSSNRMLTFARHAAPLQVSWLGYAGTTGLEAMDVVLADRFHVRTDEEGWYSERVVRLPEDYVCYGPPADAPAVSPLPAIGGDYVTFGCFNNPAKYSDRMFSAWAQILRRLPTARLLLKFNGLEDRRIQDDLRQRLASSGCSGERLLFEGWSSPGELLATYNRVDLALDTFPYSGGLTTCEALWMGVPVITFPGRTFAGRHSTSHLMNAGYGQFVSADLGGYVDLAVEWANRLDELGGIRFQMREKVRQSALCDTPRFASDFLEALRQAWRAGSGDAGPTTKY